MTTILQLFSFISSWVIYMVILRLEIFACMSSQFVNFFVPRNIYLYFRFLDILIQQAQVRSLLVKIVPARQVIFFSSLKCCTVSCALSKEKFAFFHKFMAVLWKMSLLSQYLCVLFSKKASQSCTLNCDAQAHGGIINYLHFIFILREWERPLRSRPYLSLFSFNKVQETLSHCDSCKCNIPAPCYSYSITSRNYSAHLNEHLKRNYLDLLSLICFQFHGLWIRKKKRSVSRT